MPGKLEALAILFLLLPGFLCAYVTQALAVRKAQSDTEKVIEALIFSFVLYLLTLSPFGYMLPLHWKSGQDGTFRIVADYPHLLTLSIMSIALGILYAASINHDWLMQLMRWARVTERTARTSIWNDAFQEVGGWVQVGFKDGRQILGWVRYYSDAAEDSSLFLERAAWIDGRETDLIDGPGILLTSIAAIETVTFLGYSEEPTDNSGQSEEDRSPTL